MTSEITLSLDQDVLTRIEAAAAVAGVLPERWAALALTNALKPLGVSEEAATFDSTVQDEWPAKRTPDARADQHAAALAALETYDQTGIAYPLDEVLAEVRADLETRLAAKA